MLHAGYGQRSLCKIFIPISGKRGNPRKKTRNFTDSGRAGVAGGVGEEGFVQRTNLGIAI